MNRSYHTFLLLTSVFFFGCAANTTTKPAAEFSEDVTIHRLKFEAENETLSANEENQEEVIVNFDPRNDITYSLDSLMDSVSVYNQGKKKYYQGFTIQVYTGTSSTEANEVKQDLYSILPDTRSKVSYEIPNYKVKVGEFYTRLEAENTFSQVRRKFPAAILVPQQFRIED